MRLRISIATGCASSLVIWTVDPWSLVLVALAVDILLSESTQSYLKVQKVPAPFYNITYFT